VWKKLLPHGNDRFNRKPRDSAVICPAWPDLPLASRRPWRYKRADRRLSQPWRLTLPARSLPGRISAGARNYCRNEPPHDQHRAWPAKRGRTRAYAARDSDVGAMVYSALGIDPGTTLRDIQGRPLVLNCGSVIEPLYTGRDA
jgi:hypothetical protein